MSENGLSSLAGACCAIPVCPIHPAVSTSHQEHCMAQCYRKAGQPGARKAPTTSQELLDSVAGHSLGVPTPTLRCLLSPPVLHDSAADP